MENGTEMAAGDHYMCRGVSLTLKHPANEGLRNGFESNGKGHNDYKYLADQKCKKAGDVNQTTSKLGNKHKISVGKLNITAFNTN